MRHVPTLTLLLPLLAAGWAAEPAKADAANPNANGTDPTTPINRLQGTLDIADMPHGASAVGVTGRVDYRIPGHQDIAVRADLPLLWLDNGHESRTGFGDAYLEALKTLPTPEARVTAAAALGVVVPTASHDLLGADKWQLAPKVVAALHLDGDRNLAWLQAQDFFSVSGDPDRADLHYLVVTGAFRRNLDQGVWVLGGLEDRYDWKRDDLLRVDDFRNDLTAKLEGGMLFAADKAAWVDLLFPIGDNHYLDFAISGSMLLRF